MTTPGQKPTRVRHTVLFMLCLLAMITYMDRAANANAKKDIMADLNAGGSRTPRTTSSGC